MEIAQRPVRPDGSSPEFLALGLDRISLHDVQDGEKKFGRLVASEVFRDFPSHPGVTYSRENEGCNVIWTIGDGIDSADICIYSGDGPIRYRLESGIVTTNDPAHPVRKVATGFIPGLKPGTKYGFRNRGDKIDYGHLLLDTYARGITGELVSVTEDGRPNPHVHTGDIPDPDSLRFGHTGKDIKPTAHRDSAPYMPMAVVVDEGPFDWEGDTHPQTPWEKTQIYEAHVRGITKQHPDVPEDQRGTYAGMASPSVIQHLQSIGVTAVELLPIHPVATDFHLQVNRAKHGPGVAQEEPGVTNYWAYNSMGWFAPNGRYASASDVEQQRTEFREMVKAYHRAGIEVILDVVYNHTPEGDSKGPVLNFKALGFDGVYHEDFRNFTGVGNSVNAHHPYMQQVIIDSLVFWAEEMHVDGFRFDLATTLARVPGGDGIDTGSGLIKAIEEHPRLQNVKLIAEGWDCKNGDPGRFGSRWVEWNGQFRDRARYYFRDEGYGTPIQFLVDAVGGNSLSLSPGRTGSSGSVNFITAHDGFSLVDLVSYNEKHNGPNGEGNRDGTPSNNSSNHGHEGLIPDDYQDRQRAEKIIASRARAARSMISTLILAPGVPMISHGDEFLDSRGGNNNPYCQDNRTSWLEWDRIAEHQRQFLRFVQRFASLRREHPELFFRTRPFTGRPVAGEGSPAEVEWYTWNGRRIGLGGDEDKIAFGKDRGMGAQFAVLNERDEKIRRYWLGANSWLGATFSLPRHLWETRPKKLVDTASGFVYINGDEEVRVDPRAFHVGRLATVLLELPELKL